MNIIEPTKQQLDNLVQPFLAHSNVGFAIGYASPQFQESGKFYFKSNGPLLNQANKEVPLGRDTYFEIASISKVFTATLFQLFVQNGTISGSGTPLSDYYPRGGISLAKQFLDIPLLALSNYTSGLPQDNDSAPDEPAYLPMPYTVLNMFSYLAKHGSNGEYSGYRLHLFELGFRYSGPNRFHRGWKQDRRVWRTITGQHSRA
ncbi:MAG TPA: serine hydrolase domain-containing protein, partial [Chthoniobacterales bacterium]|nr:serine hydrolase domain-containing protein [Chthoniobacterales bacterium]